MAAGPVHELADRRLAATEDRRHLRVRTPEGHAEDVGGSLQGRERLEGGQQVQTDAAVCYHSRTEGGPPVAGDGLREPGPRIPLPFAPDAVQPPKSQLDDDRQKGRAGVRDLGDLAGTPPTSGLLEHVVRVVDGAEHPVGDAHEPRSLLVEQRRAALTHERLRHLVLPTIFRVHSPGRCAAGRGCDIGGCEPPLIRRPRVSAAGTRRPAGTGSGSRHAAARSRPGP